MGKHINITGKIFGNWLVLEEVGKDNKSNYLYKCECQCPHKTIRIKTKFQMIQTQRCLSCRDDNNKEINNLKDQVFNKLIVISDPIRINGETYYDCKCLCGSDIIVRKHRTALIRNNKCHCGCEKRGVREGSSTERIYGIWSHMNYRCSEKASTSDYRNYYGRGIKVCYEWNTDNPNGYLNFKKWAFNNGYDDSLSIERVNVNDNYCPENCKWIPLKDQALNKTNTIYLDFEDGAVSLNNFAIDKNINKSTIIKRYKNGASKDELLSMVKLDNTSGVTGVSKTANGRKWRAYITINKKRIHLGTFDSLEDAAKARKEAEEKYYSEYETIGNIVKTVKVVK